MPGTLSDSSAKSSLNPLWDTALYPAIRAAKLGREVLLHYFGHLEKVEEKFQAGLVSEADKESEKVIFAELRKNFPDDDFLGEESTSDLTKVQPPPKGKGRWIVDPLDGTTNYVHQFPIFCVSIGYEVDGVMQVAVIDMPILGEVYTAVRGCGAYVNGRPLQVSKTTEFHDALLATGFFADHEQNLEEQITLFSHLVRGARGIRRAGAAAYDLAQVARGVFDGYWEKNIKPWDAAAGILLVREAGGLVLTYRGEEYTPYKNSIVAANPILAQKFVDIARPHLLSTTD
jgi:myo-inositol-1(or 4)-monophosphatase